MNFHVVKPVLFQNVIFTRTSFEQEEHELPFLTVNVSRFIEQLLLHRFIKPTDETTSTVKPSLNGYTLSNGPAKYDYFKLYIYNSKRPPPLSGRDHL